MKAAALVVASALLLAACGSGSEPAPPDTAGDDADTGGSDEGSGPSGAGDPTAGDGAEPGAGGGTAAPSGDVPSGAPPPGGETPGDPSVTVRRLDGAAECDGLMPEKVPAAVSAVVEPPSADCGHAISDGSGHVAVVAQQRRGSTEYQVFSPDGEARGRITALGNGCVSRNCRGLFPQPEGWQTAHVSGGVEALDPYVIDVLTFHPDGAPRRTERLVTPEMWVFSWEHRPDPLGGSMLALSSQTPGEATACRGLTLRVGADGSASGAPAEIGCGELVAGASSRGDSLVLEISAGDVIVTWFHPDGARATDRERDPSLARLAAYMYRLSPLLDGSLVVDEGSGWTRRYPHLQTHSVDAPAWLAARPGWTYRFTRGNAGYALFPPPWQELGSCEPAIEIRAPSGRLCGTVSFREEGGACTSRWIDQGWDGTVVQQSARDGCAYRWWPRLLAR